MKEPGAAGGGPGSSAMAVPGEARFPAQADGALDTGAESATAAPEVGARPPSENDSSLNDPSLNDSSLNVPSLHDPSLNAGPLPPEQFRKVFAGLMLGMLVGALNLTIVSPALPRIVAELGGMNHYSWVALSTTLMAAVIVPIVGKLGDIYGRKPFYVGGLVLFMIASILSGTAQTFWWLIGARLVQGIGVGTLMPLSQAIVGDLVAPRERSKYQGLIGTMFGVASVSGPPLGGWITDNFSWRWMFFVSIPVGLVALRFILKNMHLPHRRRQGRIDVLGIFTLTPALVAILLATSWGGVQYPWRSTPIVALYGVGALLLAAFAFSQTRAADPIIPPYLWRNPVFTISGFGSLTLAMAMFGAIFYVPVFAQGVLGVSVARSGFLLIPLDIGIILVAAGNGFLIARTGRFKPQMLLGLPVTALGFLLMMRIGPGGSYLSLVAHMLLVGIGIGSTMQTYTIVVQAGVPRRDLGVATGAVQFFRNVGSTVGIAVLGTMMTANVTRRLPEFLPAAGGDPALTAGRDLAEGQDLGPSSAGGAHDLIAGHDLGPSAGDAHDLITGHDLGPGAGGAHDLITGHDLGPSAGGAHDQITGHDLGPSAGGAHDLITGHDLGPSAGGAHDLITGNAHGFDVAEQLAGGDGITSLFDPARLASLPEGVAEGIRLALHETFQPVFWACLGFLAVTYALTLFLKPIELSSAADDVADDQSKTAA